MRVPRYLGTTGLLQKSAVNDVYGAVVPRVIGVTFAEKQRKCTEPRLARILFFFHCRCSHIPAAILTPTLEGHLPQFQARTLGAPEWLQRARLRNPTPSL
jgi:hypothetical protein